MKFNLFFLLAIALYCTSCHYLTEEKEANTQLRLMQEQQQLIREGLARNLESIRRSVEKNGNRADDSEVLALADSLYGKYQQMTMLLLAVEEQNNESWKAYQQTVQAALENYKQLGHELSIIDNFHLDHQVFKEDMDLLNWKRDELSTMVFQSHINTQVRSCLEDLNKMVGGCCLGCGFRCFPYQTHISVANINGKYYQYRIVVESKQIKTRGIRIDKVNYDSVTVISEEQADFAIENIKKIPIGQSLLITFQSKNLARKLIFSAKATFFYSPATNPYLAENDYKHQCYIKAKAEVTEGKVQALCW